MRDCRRSCWRPRRGWRSSTGFRCLWRSEASRSRVLSTSAGWPMSSGPPRSTRPGDRTPRSMRGSCRPVRIRDRRIEKLLNPDLSELPAFLVAEGGLNSGLMMAQVTAAALVSECKVLAHPASVDSIPTSADKEDHVSMSPIAARKFSKVVENLERVLAIELLVAFQAMEFLRPLTTSPPLELVRQALRRAIAPWRKDRVLSEDLSAGCAFLDNSALKRLAATLE